MHVCIGLLALDLECALHGQYSQTCLFSPIWYMHVVECLCTNLTRCVQTRDIVGTDLTD